MSFLETSETVALQIDIIPCLSTCLRIKSRSAIVQELHVDLETYLQSNDGHLQVLCKEQTSQPIEEI